MFRVGVLAVGFVIAFTSSGHGMQAGPTLTISNATVMEGNATLGPRAVFQVKLSSASSDIVMVDYATFDGTASSNSADASLANSAGLDIVDVAGASVFPSRINVGPVGAVRKVTVAILGYAHTWPGDVDMLLVGPRGQSVLLMSDVGEAESSVTGLNITFDDNGADMPPTPVSGTFKPTDKAGVFGADPDLFPQPAPGAPYANSLSAFNGTDPAGAWSLFVVDDSLGDMGAIAGGWKLTISTATGDYVATSGTLAFAPGVTSMTFAVPIRGDAVAEPNETFAARLSNPVNATIGGGQGTGTIVSDDGSGATPPASPAGMFADFGTNGLWARIRNSSWERIHAQNPSYVAAGDLDGNGQTEMIIDLPTGVWELMNKEWNRILASPTAGLTVGDLDGNGRADIVMNLGRGGVVAYLNKSSWIQIHPGAPSSIVTGDLDGDGRTELIMSFPIEGVFIWNMKGGLVQIHQLAAASMAAGNMDGLGGDELLVGVPNQGLFVLSSGSWRQVHAQATARMVVADLDNSGAAEAIVDFEGNGLWAFKDQWSWSQLHSSNAAVLEAGDFDGNGQMDLLAGFPGYGLMQRMNEGQWTSIHPAVPEQIAVGKFD
jgi:subtilisin-like proprotein convertase family protein